MIARAHDLFDLHPERLAADTGFGSAEMLDWLVNEQGIEPHVPVFDKSQRTGGALPPERTTSPTTTNATSMSVQAASTDHQRYAGERRRHHVLPSQQGRLFCLHS